MTSTLIGITESTRMSARGREPWQSGDPRCRSVDLMDSFVGLEQVNPSKWREKKEGNGLQDGEEKKRNRREKEREREKESSPMTWSRDESSWP